MMQTLAQLLALLPPDPMVQRWQERCRAVREPEEAVSLFDETLPRVEAWLWRTTPDAAAVALYQQAFRELETALAATGRPRHRFIVIIPVADRPQHLRNIMGSLLDLCRAFHYGGVHRGKFEKVVAVIADDSRDEAVIGQNRAIAEAFEAEGLDTRYFGAEAQSTLFDALAPERRAALHRMLGDPGQQGFAHKGASVTRNFAYLLAGQLIAEDEKSLCLFVDSDQQFKVRVPEGEGYRDVVGINYFYHLDRIFSGGDVEVVTGKVVGDPPVSPAVMAGNFLADVTAFLAQIAALDPDERCEFHGEARQAEDDAAYHDMADLFGFNRARTAYRYHCTCAGEHDHADCLSDFSRKLDRFFHGEHPTRISHYAHAPDLGLKPARTIYTGNYVFSATGLRHFIPFASLKLRMAGPVLGRLIKAELGARFVSANLPLLHTRTMQDQEAFEFRPGVNREAAGVDLSGEFERQFFGDVMLFTVEALVERGYPERPLSEGEFARLLDSVEASMYRKYLDKRREIQRALEQACALFEDGAMWWRQRPGLEVAKANFDRFFADIRRNFSDDAPGYRLIAAGENRARRRRKMLEALTAYGSDRESWEALLAGREPPPEPEA